MFCCCSLSCREKSCAYMPLVIQLVVGEFELVKADHLPHPRVPWGQRIWVDVDPRRNRRVCVSRHHPLGAVVHIPRKHSGKPGLSNAGAHKRIHEDESELMLEIQRFHLTLHVLEDLCMFKSSNSKCYCKLFFLSLHWDFFCFDFLIMFPRKLVHD